jgi:RsiW-degrading membrane proteinase PrsW (M82 family)
VGRNEKNIPGKVCVTPSWAHLIIGFLGPLFLVSLLRLVDLSETPVTVFLHFSVGALLSFVALLGENYAFSAFASSIPVEYRLAAETFVFIALTEELVKIAQISELARRSQASLRSTIAIGLAVAAGFAGAENVIYLFRYSDIIASLLLIRTLTANPLHLSVGVIAASLIYEAIKDEDKSHYMAIALLAAVGIHGLYDYSILSSGGRSAGGIVILLVSLAWAWRVARRSKQAIVT